MSSEAELYALTHRGNPGDLEFYQRLCRGARTVLELGSGYGRVLAGLSDGSRSVVGLECDAAVIALARRRLRALSPAQRRLARLVQGDFRHFELAERFDRVLLPYNALYCLLRKRDALACFRSARLALKPRGVFAFDVWNAAPLDRSARARNAHESEPIVCLAHRGRMYDVFERSRLNRARKRVDVTYGYRPRDGGQGLEVAIPQRYFLVSEIDELLQRAGLVLAARYGDFRGGRYTANAPHQIVLARTG